MSNVLIPKYKVNRVTTKGGKMTSEAVPSKEINETRINNNEPPRLEEACTETINERCSAVLLNELPSKEKDPRNFTTPCQVLEKHKEAEDLVADHLSRLEEACTETINERCSAVLLNELPSKEKDPRNFTTPCQVLEKHKEAEDLVADHLSRAIKRILERSVGYNPKYWSEKLNDALWVFRTVYKTPTGYTPFRIVYGKACYLPVEIKHKAHWVLKQCNMDLILASEIRLMQLNELAELRDGAYKNNRIYKERAKKWHGSRLRGDKDIMVCDKRIPVYGYGVLVSYTDLAEKEIDKVDEVSII
nr:reverse transcriptase domain-containing protein [Tanacetum cinerariifolium]